MVLTQVCSILIVFRRDEPRQDLCVCVYFDCGERTVGFYHPFDPVLCGSGTSLHFVCGESTRMKVCCNSLTVARCVSEYVDQGSARRLIRFVHAVLVSWRRVLLWG